MRQTEKKKERERTCPIAVGFLWFHSGLYIRAQLLSLYLLSVLPYCSFASTSSASLSATIVIIIMIIIVIFMPIIVYPRGLFYYFFIIMFSTCGHVFSHGQVTNTVFRAADDFLLFIIIMISSSLIWWDGGNFFIKKKKPFHLLTLYIK